MFRKMLANICLKSIARETVEPVLKAYRTVRSENPSLPYAELCRLTLPRLVGFRNPEQRTYVNNTFCNSLEGICYFIALELKADVDGMMGFRCVQLTQIIDQLLYIEGVRPQGAAARAELFRALRLPAPPC